MDTQIHINYDTAFGEDDEMSQTDIHNALIYYLMNVLNRLFSGRNIGVFTSISLYGAPISPSRYKSPDLLVIDGLVSNPNQEIASYRIDSDHPAPSVLMEICSEDNWQQDVEADQKPAIYAQMGVPEYFAVDPHIEQVWTGEWSQQGRLIGWRLNGQLLLPDDEAERQAKLAAQNLAETAPRQVERLKERLLQLDPNFNENDC
jgi:Uma2 family endonuclease